MQVMMLPRTAALAFRTGRYRNTESQGGIPAACFVACLRRKSLLLRACKLPFGADPSHRNLLNLVFAACGVNVEHDFVVGKSLALQDANAVDLVRTAFGIGAYLGFGLAFPVLCLPG